MQQDLVFQYDFVDFRYTKAEWNWLTSTLLTQKPEQLSFKGTNDTNYLATKLDVTDKSSIDTAFKQALDKFKRVDVVVNNAGYGLSGCFEVKPLFPSHMLFSKNDPLLRHLSSSIS
jgi:NAD(P)-dependent dehydrogenase (short-subunit alcohol dehydrogenase family)